MTVGTRPVCPAPARITLECDSSTPRALSALPTLLNQSIPESAVREGVQLFAGTWERYERKYAAFHEPAESALKQRAIGQNAGGRKF